MLCNYRLFFFIFLLNISQINATIDLSIIPTKPSCIAIQHDEPGCFCRKTRRTGQAECCCIGVQQLPFDLSPDVGYLYLYNVSITEITSNFFENYTFIRELEIDSSIDLEHFDGSSLSVLPKLRKLSVTKCENLKEISGKLLMNNTRIQNVILRNNGLITMPSLEMSSHHLVVLDRIDLSMNRIKFIGDSKVRQVRARNFYLNHNNLYEISGYAFAESRFVKLKLDNNPNLNTISVDAFKSMNGLEILDLSQTSISFLPINGLQDLKTLVLNEVPNLKHLPSVLSFTNLQNAQFTYPHHCCLFKYVDDVTLNENGKYQKNAKELHKRICNRKKEKNQNNDQMRRRRRRRRRREMKGDDLFEILFREWTELENDTIPHGLDDIDDGELPPFTEISAEPCDSVIEEVQRYYSNITCFPQPDSLNPCENIVGYPFLRIAIWVVCLAAIVGNIIVWIMLGMAYEKRMRMHYIYMINMSVADMITGIYLAVLAIADAKMSDEYYRHAVWWQTGWGCRAAGFLAVFASELGIISMFFIAFEMSYNTRQSMRGRRLGPKVGIFLMFCGWLFAILMAILPWFGVSSYSESSICLPLKASTLLDKSYLIFGLTFNFCSFAAMTFSYGFIVKMLKENESRDEDRTLITKMSLLVGTDMICWFPTLFFGFTAAIGYPLISLSNAKFVLVFFFPINAFANPFLYVFFTEVIQHRVRNKTLPVIRRITTTNIRGLSSLSNFYHSQPPGSHRPSRDEPANPMFLGVTQTTSLNSTPRGSNVSRPSDAMLYDFDRRSSASPRVSFDVSPRVSFDVSPRVSFDVSPRVSFDIPASPTTPKIERKRGMSFFRRFVSTIPEVSDLSEHSSESRHEHTSNRNILDENEEEEEARRGRIRTSFNRIFHLGRRRNETDSGRGSLASSADIKDQQERNSISSNNSNHSPLLSSPPPPSSSSRNFILPPDRLRNRRKSTPAIPLLVVSDCS